MTISRYGLYYTPDADSALTSAARSWLGYDAWTGQSVERATTDFVNIDTLDRWTMAPRRYGFHATLKAPFRLADAMNEADLLDTVDAFSRSAVGPVIDTLILRWIGPFLALVPQDRSPALNAHAAGVVEHFEPFRAPLNDAETEKRLRAPLNDRQRDYLQKWGYPYVFDEFRFHMTLTGPITDSEQSVAEQAARNHFSEFLGRPLAIDRLVIFHQASSKSAFKIMRSFPLSDDPHGSPDRTDARSMETG